MEQSNVQQVEYDTFTRVLEFVNTARERERGVSILALSTSMSSLVEFEIDVQACFELVENGKGILHVAFVVRTVLVG